MSANFDINCSFLSNTPAETEVVPAVDVRLLEASGLTGSVKHRLLCANHGRKHAPCKNTPMLILHLHASSRKVTRRSRLPCPTTLSGDLLGQRLPDIRTTSQHRRYCQPLSASTADVMYEICALTRAITAVDGSVLAQQIVFKTRQC